LFVLGLALWLRSLVSVLTLPVAFAPIIARILIEERTLRETLPGYGEYMQKVRNRLIPHFW
jgi:protein-S-isoprenylcysteine O-methyltransferase Ste14